MVIVISLDVIIVTMWVRSSQGERYFSRYIHLGFSFFSNEIYLSIQNWAIIVSTEKTNKISNSKKLFAWFSSSYRTSIILQRLHMGYSQILTMFIQLIFLWLNFLFTLLIEFYHFNLISTRNYIQYPVISHSENEYTHLQQNHFAAQQKLAQHCKSTILQKNIF